MKFILIIMSFSLIPCAFSSLDKDVFIRGKVGGSFNDEQVTVIDSFKQTYKLPKRLFPKDFQFRQGAEFSISVPETELNKLKIKTPK